MRDLLSAILVAIGGGVFVFVVVFGINALIALGIAWISGWAFWKCFVGLLLLNVFIRMVRGK